MGAVRLDGSVLTAGVQKWAARREAEVRRRASNGFSVALRDFGKHRLSVRAGDRRYSADMYQRG
jgi:hypothetical protein